MISMRHRCSASPPAVGLVGTEDASLGSARTVAEIVLCHDKVPEKLLALGDIISEKDRRYWSSGLPDLTPMRGVNDVDWCNVPLLTVAAIPVPGADATACSRLAKSTSRSRSRSRSRSDADADADLDPSELGTLDVLESMPGWSM